MALNKALVLGIIELTHSYFHSSFRGAQWNMKSM